MLYLPTFLNLLVGGCDFPRRVSKAAPRDAPGSLACVSRVYCLMFREPFLEFRAACAGCTALAAALGGDGWFLPLLAMGRAWNLDDTTYAGFSWHVAGDPELLRAARQALATKKHARQTAIKWDDEAVRETDDGGYVVWKEPVTLKAAHAWFMRVFEGLERATGDKKKPKPGLTGKSKSGKRPWMLVPHPREFDPELVRQQRQESNVAREETEEKEQASTSWWGGRRHEWNVVEGIVAPEVLQWLLADPDLKEHLGLATLASTQHPDQMCKKGMRHEFGRKLSFSGRLCASGTASLNGVALQRDFVGRTRAWNQAFLLKNECVITEMVGKAIAEVGLVMIIHLMISLMPPSSPRQA